MVQTIGLYLLALGVAVQTGTSRLTILFFTAPWCAPCRAVAPILDNTVKNNKEKVSLVSIDFDIMRNEAERWDVKEIPVVIVLRDGGVLLRVDGADPPALNALRRGLENLLKPARKGRKS